AGTRVAVASPVPTSSSRARATWSCTSGGGLGACRVSVTGCLKSRNPARAGFRCASVLKSASTLRKTERHAVSGRGHAEQQRDREHEVDARRGAGNLARFRLLFVGRGHDAEDFLLVRPDEDPHIESHDRPEPCADADSELIYVHGVAAHAQAECAAEV